MAFSGCKSFSLEKNHSARRSICSCSGIAFSRSETLKYGQCCPTMKVICWCSESRFQAANRSEICSAVSQGCWFVDAQEMRIQVAKRSDMGNAVMKGLRFADTQELCFEAWKRSNMACFALLCCRFADSQISRFQASNVQIWVVLSQKLVVLLIFKNSVVFSCKTLRYGLCRTARGSICCLSGIEFSGLETFR